MHAHAAHEGQRPHQDGIHAKFAADAAGFIQADGVGLHPATAFLGQQCVQDGSKPAACLLQHSLGVADDLVAGVAVVALDTVGLAGLRGEEVVVMQQDGGAVADGAGAVPTAQGRTPLCQAAR